MLPPRLLLATWLVTVVPACTAVIGEPGFSPDAGGSDASTAELVPSNMQPSLLELGMEPLVIRGDDKLVEIDTDTGTITRLADGESLLPAGVSFAKLSQTGGPELGVFACSRLEIESGATVLVRGKAALGFAVNGSAYVDGVLNASGGLYAPGEAGPGGFAGGDVESQHGQGPGGGRFGDEPDTGGGGGGHVARGGEGGGRDDAPGGAGGSIQGSPELIPLAGGAGGGAGGGDNDELRGNGVGGGGGGAVQISARDLVRVGATGGINCGGGGGQGGVFDNGGGGGGAGGAILLEAVQVEVAGMLAANGGGGGAGADGAARGASGESGLLSSSPAKAGSGLGEGSAGGAGGAGDDAEGKPGVATSGDEGVDENAGGGGGAAGRVRVRSRDGAHIQGVISPMTGFSEVRL